MEGLLYLGRPQNVLLGFNPSLIILNFVGNRCWTRKGIMFWIEMLIMNSAEEPSLSGTQFRAGAEGDDRE